LKHALAVVAISIDLLGHQPRCANRHPQAWLGGTGIDYVSQSNIASYAHDLQRLARYDSQTLYGHAQRMCSRTMTSSA